MTTVLCGPASLALALASLAAAATAQAQAPLPDPYIAALANELSGETAKRNVEGIAAYHRQRGSKGFHAAADLVATRAQEYGLDGVEVVRFAADGKIFYGTQRSRPAWDADEGDLLEVQGAAVRKIASYAAEPIVLAEDSESADVTANLVDVGDGTKAGDYEGKDVKGKIVLVAAQPGAAQDLAIGRFGAVGIVSYAQNQRTAWYGEDENLIRWGHLKTFSDHKTFAFMVSLKTARDMRKRLAGGETIRLHALVKAGQHEGFYEVVTAAIPGSDARLKDEQITFSCHLDHQLPGANDNASGCATILEVARTLQKLIGNGTLPRPARTLRFVWPPEIEGTLALLTAWPGFATRTRAVVHMDMVGGGPETKAVFHVTRGPMSLPSFVHDVGWNFARWVNDETYRFAATGESKYPLVAPEGGKEPLRAEDSPFQVGSDHQVYQDSSFKIPAIYFNDWPDRFIHTNFDSVANIDPTKLKRVAFIAAASAYVLADERRFGQVGDGAPGVAAGPDASGEGKLVFRRMTEPRGPLEVFGYDYFSARAEAAGVTPPKLLSYQGLRGGGDLYTYEALNFADGKRNAQQIDEALSVEFGPVPLDLVVEYLRALEKIGVVKQTP
jgi:aminopeptidase YwaD